jgi:hypothetical protein
LTDRRSDLYAQFPSLQSSEHRITSQPVDDYNCVAWVNRITDRWLEPGLFWPLGVPEPEGDDDVECYVALFERWQFIRCDTSDYEPGFLKIALYTVGKSFQHVAKQLRNGHWSSKAGTLHDLRHATLGALQPSGVMRNATPSVFMKRVDNGEDMTLEETGLILG